ncbi:MAG: hypothetical protein LBJ62_10695 [Bifidobacteriaceae bacterium]|jgi:predicted metal-dependent HD superfamily phosphohydrolase|nr:hypothetical protein [Bifidobacteriaceae bacterium]
MDRNDYPDWLLGVWSRALLAAGATASPSEITRLGSKLLERWANPARMFHNMGHLITVLEKIDELHREASCPCLVRLAAFYHGAVLSTDLLELGRHTWGEDEVQSAGLAYNQLLHLGLTESAASRVRHLVTRLGSRTAAAPVNLPSPQPASVPAGPVANPSASVPAGSLADAKANSLAGSPAAMPARPTPSAPPGHAHDPDFAVLCDAERFILASDPRTYRHYAAAVRRECADAPPTAVLQVRLSVLRHWLAEDRLFLTAAAAPWEAAARHNVAGELARAELELSALMTPAGGQPPAGVMAGESLSGPLAVKRGVSAAALMARAPRRA